MPPNHRLHPNAAIALCLHAGHEWRGVGEPNRSACMRAVSTFLISGLVFVSFCVRGQVATTNGVAVPQAVTIASALRLEMSSEDADAFLRQQGLTPGIDLMSTNGKPAARLFSMSVGGHTPPRTMYYALADGCVLALHVTVDAWHAESGRLDRAAIQSNGVDIVSVRYRSSEFRHFGCPGIPGSFPRRFHFVSRESRFPLAHLRLRPGCLRSATCFGRCRLRGSALFFILAAPAFSRPDLQFIGPQLRSGISVYLVLHDVRPGHLWKLKPLGRTKRLW